MKTMTVMPFKTARRERAGGREFTEVHEVLSPKYSKRCVPSGFAISLMVTVLALSFSGFGQAITGDILGTVRDSSGAVVEGAKVVLTATDTGVTAEAASDNNGDYLFSQLKPGRYSVAVSKHGFSSYTISNVDVRFGERPRVDFTLKVGAVTEEVNVSAGSIQLLQPETSSMGQAVTTTAVQNLPIANRNYVDLLTIAAGVTPILPGGGESPANDWTGISSAHQGAVTVSVAGGRESDVSFLVDGIETRNARFGAANLRPSFDAIQEMKVQTTNFSAENGRSGGLISTTLKGGTNQFHGDIFDYVRNDFFNADDLFLTLNHQPQNTVRYNDFGGSFGGPVILPFYNGTNKTFFFFNYEGIRNPKTQTLTAVNPSAAQLAGHLADNSAGTGIFPTSDPFCVANPSSAHCVDIINPLTHAPFPGNDISSALNPVIQKWVTGKFWPAANVANPVINPVTGFPTVNYSLAGHSYANWDQYNARVDHTISSRDQLWGSYTHDNRPTLQAGAEPLSGTFWPLSDDLATLTETHVFSPHIVNEFRLGYNRGKTYNVSQGALGTNYAQQFGLTNTSTNPFDFGVPNISLSTPNLANVSSLFTTIGSPSESIGALDQNVQGTDNLSLALGKHNVKVGFDYIREKFEQITDFSGVPVLAFSGQFSGKTGSVSELADALLGDPEQATVAVGNSAQDLRSNYYGTFVQDDWKIRQNLTLNLGVRYEYTTTPWDIHNRTGWFNPTIGSPPGQIQYSDLGQVRNGVVEPDYRNFAPRVGFAYSAPHDFVIRGGGGIFYATDNWNELQFLVLQPRYYGTQTLISDPTTPTLSMDTLFPPGSLGGGLVAGSSPFSLRKSNRTPYVEQWNLDIQHTFAKDWVLDVGYIGNTGVKLPQRRNQNAGAFDPTGTVPLQDRVPFPQLGTGFILETYNEGWSNYNGLVVRAEKRFSNGFYFLGSYTYSHEIDLGNTDDFSVTSNLNTQFFDKGNGDYDVRHRAVFSYSYELPFGRGKKFLGSASRALDTLVGGWQLNGISTFSTGQYSTPVLPASWVNLGTFNSAIADRIGNPYPSQQTYNNYFNINAFAYPGCPGPTACATGIHLEGNAGRNSLLQPGINNWDMGLQKRIPIRERFNAEFRADAYNIWNHPQYSNANNSVGPGFGTITLTTTTPAPGLRVAPRILQLSLRLMF